VNLRWWRRNPDAESEANAVAVDAARGREVIEQSREIVVVLDDERRVVAASRRARESLPGLQEGEPLPARAADGRRPLEIAYDVLGRGETLVYLSEPAENAAYEELRAGFTAAVSHELRTPLARLLALLDTALLPGADARDLIVQAREEVEHARELIDDVLFLSELETGREVVSLGTTAVLPVLEEAAASMAERAERAGVAIDVSGDPGLVVPVRPRMLRVVIDNLTANALQYAGPDTTFELSVSAEDGHVVVRAVDDGPGVDDVDLPRLFERFYRGDRARASQGTGLGLAIVKHVVNAAGGQVEARRPGRGGLEIRCVFGTQSA
jgi:two-component system, OmpR family, phosphate regulon sensor histidine kinase PhoR